VVANSLPQALILTAIVIGFALLVFIFILFFKTYQELGTVNTEDMNDAETPAAGPAAPEKVGP
jgi:multicomponent Na+:H+ antiporter subunit C